MNKKTLILKVLNEITQSNQNQTPKPIIRVEDAPITKFIINFFKKRKDADLIVLNSNGDIWTIDVRAIVVSEETQMQSLRERAKSLTYEIKRELEEALMKAFLIPNMSIQGLKQVQNNTCDFVISFIYSNKNIDRTNFYESKNPKVAKVLKDILKESEPSKEDHKAEIAKYQKEVKKFTDAYHKFTEQGKTTEAKQALKSANEAEENITKCKTSIAKLNESKQSLTKGVLQEYDAKDEERIKGLKGGDKAQQMANSIKDPNKAFNRYEAAVAIAPRIAYIFLNRAVELGHTKAKEVKDEQDQKQRARWKKEDEENTAKAKIKADKFASAVKKKYPDMSINITKESPVQYQGQRSGVLYVTLGSNKLSQGLVGLGDQRKVLHRTHNALRSLADKFNGYYDITYGKSYVRFDGNKITTNESKALTEDVYYPQEKPKRNYKQELQEYVDEWVEEQIGSEAANGWVEDYLSGYKISVNAIPYKSEMGQMVTYEAGEKVWMESAEELCDYLNNLNYKFTFQVGNAGPSMSWVYTENVIKEAKKLKEGRERFGEIFDNKTPLIKQVDLAKAKEIERINGLSL